MTPIAELAEFQYTPNFHEKGRSLTETNCIVGKSPMGLSEIDLQRLTRTLAI